MTDDKAKKESSHKTKMKKLKENVTRGEDKFQNFEFFSEKKKEERGAVKP